MMMGRLSMVVLHSTAHHSVGKKSCNAGITVISVRIAEVSLESLPVHRIICPQESQIWEEPIKSELSYRPSPKGKDLLLKTVK